MLAVFRRSGCRVTSRRGEDSIEVQMLFDEPADAGASEKPRARRSRAAPCPVTRRAPKRARGASGRRGGRVPPRG
jgi:hypothetical protein